MARRRHTAEEIVAKLRQVNVLMAQGRLVADAARAIERIDEVSTRSFRPVASWSCIIAQVSFDRVASRRSSLSLA